jgi:hypothetical protein
MASSTGGPSRCVVWCVVCRLLFYEVCSHDVCLIALFVWLIGFGSRFAVHLYEESIEHRLIAHHQMAWNLSPEQEFHITFTGLRVLLLMPSSLFALCFVLLCPVWSVVLCSLSSVFFASVPRVRVLCQSCVCCSSSCLLCSPRPPPGPEW